MDDGKTHLVAYPLLLSFVTVPIISSCTGAFALVSVSQIMVQGLQMIHLIPHQTWEEAWRECWRVN